MKFLLFSLFTVLTINLSPSRQLEIIPTHEAITLGLVDPKVKEILQPSYLIQSNSFINTIQMFQKIKKEALFKGKKKTAETANLILRELNILRSVAKGEALIIDKKNGLLKTFSFDFAKNVEEGLQKYGIMLPGLDWEIGPASARKITEKEWYISYEKRIHSGIWAGAYLYKNKFIVLPGMEVLKSDSKVTIDSIMSSKVIGNSDDSIKNLKTGILKGAGVYLRAKPKLDGKKLLIVRFGTVIFIIDENNFSNGWYKILTDNGTIGWVKREFIQEFDNDRSSEIYYKISRDKIRNSFNFGDLVEVTNFLNDLCLQSSNTNFFQNLNYCQLRLTALKKSIEMIPSGYEMRRPYVQWIDEHKDNPYWEEIKESLNR